MEQLDELRTQLKSLISPADTQRFSPRPGPSPARGVQVTATRYQQSQALTPPARPSTSKVEVSLGKNSPPKNLWSMLLPNWETEA